jgi:hypothetical protein
MRKLIIPFMLMVATVLFAQTFNGTVTVQSGGTIVYQNTAAQVISTATVQTATGSVAGSIPQASVMIAAGGLLNPNDVVNRSTGATAGGNFTYPTTQQTLNTVNYGASGTEFTGGVSQAAVAAVASGVTYGPSLSLLTGTGATDKAAVTAAAAWLIRPADGGSTILGISGTFNLTSDRATQYSNGAANQLTTDKAAVTAGAGSILNSLTLLTVQGTYSLSANFSDPGISHVTSGTSYLYLGSTLTGTSTGGTGKAPIGGLGLQ